MGHGLLLERKHVARGLPFPDELSSTGRYSVLTLLSEGYPHLKDRFPCLTHPFATLPGDCSPFTSDLHVLSTPPAFVLSQDQTLQFHFLPDSGPRSALLLFSCQRSPLPSGHFSPRIRANLLILPQKVFPVNPSSDHLPAARRRATRFNFIRSPRFFVKPPSETLLLPRSSLRPPPSSPPRHHQIHRRKNQKGFSKQTMDSLTTQTT